MGIFSQKCYKRSPLSFVQTLSVYDVKWLSCFKLYFCSLLSGSGTILWGSTFTAWNEHHLLSAHTCYLDHVHVTLMQPSMANLNSPSSRVVKDLTPFRRWILRCKNIGKGESWPSLFLDEVNLYLMKFRHRWILNEHTFYSFIILFIWKWILT